MASTAYPPFRGPRLRVAEARQTGGPVAGRVAKRSGRLWLVDASGDVALHGVDGEHVASGDWVSGRLTGAPSGPYRLECARVHAPARATSPDRDLPSRLPLLRRRAAVFAAARTFFREEGFLEVDTPARVRCPGLEPHLRAFPAGDGRWLITSPELHLKRLLAAGAEKLVEFARAFRDDERGRWHRSEFTLVEWYRAFEGLETIEADCEALVTACAAIPEVDLADTLADCDLSPPFERTTVRAALHRHTGLDLAELQHGDDLERALRARGHLPGPGADWDELFFRIWIAEVEPRLGRERPVFVHDYPASQAALARTRREPWGEVAERFELYVNGVEIANAFHELNDPREQRRRHEADRRERRDAGLPAYPLDDVFLAALESGMPPASGVALGLDRLAAVLLGADSLDAISPFPESGPGDSGLG